MILTVLAVATAVITLSPINCLADNSGLKPFLGKPYKLLSSDKNFGKVLEALGISWLWRNGHPRDKTPLLTLKWNPVTDVYSLTERSITHKSVETFQIGYGSFIKKAFGRTVVASFTLNGTTLTETQEVKGKPTLVIVRTYSNDEVVVKYQISGIVSYKVYHVVYQ